MHLVDLVVPTDKLLETGVEPRPSEPGSHTGQAHCSEWLAPLRHRGRLVRTYNEIYFYRDVPCGVL